jgi:hypothetical protein
MAKPKPKRKPKPEPTLIDLDGYLRREVSLEEVIMAIPDREDPARVGFGN